MPAGRVSMYSMPSQPPQDWPRRWIASSPSARAHGADFPDEAFDGPKGSIVGMIGTTATELVIEDDRALGRETFERLQVVVTRAWATVQDEKRDAATADAPIPDAMAIDGYGALINLHGWTRRAQCRSQSTYDARAAVDCAAKIER